jgi:hypothetical protein
VKDYHAILGITANSEKSEIQKAYRRLAKKYHPDVNKSANAHDKFIEITEAYEFLIEQLKHPGKEYITISGQAQDKQSSGQYSEYERQGQEAREKAQRQAQMRYEEFKKQHEAFLVSGMNDLVLILKIIGRIFIIPVFLGLLLAPILIALQNEWQMIFIAFLTWPFAGIIAWNAFDKRKNYFKPGQFYYSFRRIKELFSETKDTKEKCHYCREKIADSWPYKLEMLKLKDIKVQTSGARQHNVNYINKSSLIQIPRSRKAFKIHTMNIGIKVLSILSCLVFLDISSLVWRFLLGILSGGLLCTMVLLIAKTKSNVSYLFDYGTLLRLIIWFSIIILISRFSVHPFDITTGDPIYFVVFSIFLFDNLLMLIVNLLLGKYTVKPIIKQHENFTQSIKSGYKVYNDVIIISVVYPIFRWIFG